MKASYEQWLSTRPVCVQEMAAKWPPSRRISIRGVIHYVLGYTEEGDDRCGLWVTPINPWKNYNIAVARKVLICADDCERIEERQT